MGGWEKLDEGGEEEEIFSDFPIFSRSIRSESVTSDILITPHRRSPDKEGFSPTSTGASLFLSSQFSTSSISVKVGQYEKSSPVESNKEERRLFRSIAELCPFREEVPGVKILVLWNKFGLYPMYNVQSHTHSYKLV